MEPTQIQTNLERMPQRNKEAQIALVLGIVGFFSAFVFALAGIVCGVVGLVLGLRGRRSEKGNLASVGMMLSGLAIGFSFIHALLKAVLMTALL
ncbi:MULTISPECIES: hypothetical protein [Laceyella]|jgi:hypothetical protein|uniref:DUF4190 domain-containing protein n=1 Tax=Laceyella sediminis TaxID=573074 RepID=A0ABX5EU19_9BACL|nr:hypothetical protein [Laceyella sediminis]MRG29757.1 hypothetical protein [Laceyella tengchongensis]PRZ17451.1 hypothetical protein CLV36_101566 [Laceyella sediminis]